MEYTWNEAMKRHCKQNHCTAIGEILTCLCGRRPQTAKNSHYLNSMFQTLHKTIRFQICYFIFSYNIYRTKFLSTCTYQYLYVLINSICKVKEYNDRSKKQKTRKTKRDKTQKNRRKTYQVRVFRSSLV